MPSSPAFVRQFTAELEPFLTGDQLLAGAEVVAGPSPYPTALIAGAAGLGIGVALDAIRRHALLPPQPHHLVLDVVISCGSFAAVVVLHGVIACLHRPTVVAVTRQQVLVCKLTRMGKHLKRVDSAPLDAIIISRHRGTRRTTAVTFELPAAGRKFRLRGSADKRRDLNRVLATAAALGVTACPPPAIDETRSPLEATS